jgi:hypothetical protein
MITPTPFPTSTSAPLPTPYPTLTPFPTGTAMPVPTDTPLPTLTPFPTGTAMPVPTDTPLPTLTPNPTTTGGPVPTDTPLPTLPPNPTGTDMPVPTDTPLPTLPPNPTGTAMPVPTDPPLPTLPPPPTLPPAPTLAPIPVQQFVWGNNKKGQLGLGTNAGVLSPLPMGQPGEYSEMQFSSQNGAFLKYDGSLWLTGTAQNGILGNNSSAIFSGNFSPVQEITNSQWQDYSLSNTGVLAVKDDGSLWGWGGIQMVMLQSKATQIGIAEDWSSVANGQDAYYVIKNDASLWSFGRNNYGQLGIVASGNVTASTPVSVMSGTNDWSMVEAGMYTGFAIKNDGTMYAWGANQYGQLGDGTVVNKSSPVHIGSGITWSDVFTAGSATYGLTSGGELYGWGVANYGLLGSGGLTYSSNPIQIGSGMVFETAELGSVSTATLSSGLLYTMGNGGDGQLGNGTYNQTVTSLAPVSFPYSWLGLNTGNSTSVGGFAVLPTATPSPTYYPVPTATPPVFLMIPFNFNFTTSSFYPDQEGFYFTNNAVSNDILKLQYVSNLTTETNFVVNISNESDQVVVINLGKDNYEVLPFDETTFELNMFFGNILTVYCHGNVTIGPDIITGSIASI